MFGDKKITTLAEDFQVLGLIRQAAPAQEAQVNKKAAPVNNQTNQKLVEQKKALAAKKLVEEKRKASLKKIAEIKHARLIKRVQEAKKKVQKEGTVSSTLKNLMALEQKLKTTTAVGDLIKAFENVSKVSQLAMNRFRKLAEAEALADKGQEVTPDMNDKTDRPQAGKDVPASYKDVLGGKDIEGDVGYDKEDEQEGNQEKTGEVDTVTGKYAGRDSTADAEEVDIVEGEEPGHEGGEDIETEDDEVDSIGKAYGEGEEETSGEDELPATTEDELAINPEQPSEEDAEMGDGVEDTDDTDFSDDELDSLSDEELTALEAELAAPETEPKLKDEDETGPSTQPAPGGVIPEEDDETEPDEDDAVVPAATTKESRLAKIQREAAAKKAALRKESKITKKAYISELADMKKEAEDVMARIRKNAITPQDAEALLKDIVMRLGGAVGDLADMSKYNGSGVETKFENKKPAKRK
jgi:hypothetical protein